jgi:hypothetical protein
MTQLSELIEVRHRSVRAVNLDSDLGDPDVLRGYSPGAHVIDALRRITISLQDDPRTRAWSITGPYGAGKSSFAHLLCSLLGPQSEPTYEAALEVMSVADPQLTDTITRERLRLGIEDRGIIPAAIAAERESITQALLRALCRGAELYWTGPGRKPDVLHELRDTMLSSKPSPELVFSCLDNLAAHAPVLVIVDELGKNLEYAADRPSDGDLYVLQRLAERFSSSTEFSGGVLTLAHLAFDDYLVGAGNTRRREWRKIHGRFDDIPFVANTAHALGLLAEALTVSATSAQKQAIEVASIAADEAIRVAAPSVPTPATVTGSAGATYPLHPIVAAALPAIASKLGQHDRSLVAFLTSDAPHALSAFLANHDLSDEHIPFLRLSGLYDYFFEDGAATAFSGPEGDRAREIRACVDEAIELDDFERGVLKTVAMLNLIAGADKIVANTPLIEESVVGPRTTPAKRRGVRAVLERLTERSLLTYRDFAGEYRVWEGSDFDVTAHVAVAREQLTLSGTSSEQVLAIVAEAQPLRPAVARRHSQQHHVLRYFASQYTDCAPDAGIEPPDTNADGLALWVLTDGKAPASLPPQTSDGRPLVVVWSPYGDEVREVALDFAAATAVLRSAHELERDAVARREMRHRVAALQATLANRIDDAFNDRRPGVYWFSAGKRKRAQGPAELSRLLSDLCDRRFPQTPIIRNEMVNRRELTSQGAKARRVLLERMFTQAHEPRLGIQGYGPERAMYEAVLHHTGLHGSRREQVGFGPPPKTSELADAWSHLMERLDDAVEHPLAVEELYQGLIGPPFGMKAGVIPVLLSAALQYRTDDVFLYEDGSFQPLVSPAHIERLLKAPNRFALKRASLIGLRASVFEQLRQTLATDAPPSNRQMRNQTTLAVVRPLMAFAGALPEYTRSTSSTSDVAQRVCEALLHAREPDELLFTVLPEACELKSFSARASRRNDSRASDYVDRLRRALGELGSAYPRLLEQVGDLLHAGFDVVGPKTALREDLRSRSRRLLGQVIEPKMRAFLMTAADENLDDADWLEALAMTLAAKPPSSWTDNDLVVFEAVVAERAQWFQRLEVLHHQMHGAQSPGFDARRVTLTAPDGRETAELVSVAPATRKLVADVLDAALTKLEARLGAQASRALLGILADRLLSDEDAKTEDVPVKKRRTAKA